MTSPSKPCERCKGRGWIDYGPYHAIQMIDCPTCKGLKFAKPERRRYVKNRARGQEKRTRKQVIEQVYRDKKMTCERCGVRVKRPSECTWEGDPRMAQVNEPGLRSKGADPLDAKQCELTCQACHMPNGEHAPTVERMETIKARTKR